MTIIDRPTFPRSPVTPAITTPASAPLGGRYVTTDARRPAGEGAYVTVKALSSGPTVTGRPARRGTYVTTSMPADQRGGRYTCSA